MKRRPLRGALLPSPARGRERNDPQANPPCATRVWVARSEVVVGRPFDDLGLLAGGGAATAPTCAVAPPWPTRRTFCSETVAFQADEEPVVVSDLASPARPGRSRGGPRKGRRSRSSRSRFPGRFRTVRAAGPSGRFASRTTPCAGSRRSLGTTRPGRFPSRMTRRTINSAGSRRRSSVPRMKPITSFLTTHLQLVDFFGPDIAGVGPVKSSKRELGHPGQPRSALRDGLDRHPGDHPAEDHLGLFRPPPPGPPPGTSPAPGGAA